LARRNTLLLRIDSAITHLEASHWAVHGDVIFIDVPERMLGIAVAFVSSRWSNQPYIFLYPWKFGWPLGLGDQQKSLQIH